MFSPFGDVKEGGFSKLLFIIYNFIMIIMNISERFIE